MSKSVMNNIVNNYTKIIKKFSPLECSHLNFMKSVNNLTNRYLELKINCDLDLKSELIFIKNDKIYFKLVDSYLNNNIKKSLQYYLEYYDKNYLIYKQDENKLLNKINNSSECKIDVIFDIYQLRNLYAKQNGFYNYYNYSYIEGNKHNYSYTDVLKIREYVIKYLVPINDALGNENNFKFCFNDIEKIKKYIENNLIPKDVIKSIKILSDKSGWHLKFLPYSRKYCIYSKFKNNQNDIFNLSHEFGHIFQLSNYQGIIDHVYFDYDLSEIFSSYNEILCVNYLNDKNLIKCHLKKILKIIISSTLMDEFNEFFYKCDKFVLENINYKWDLINKKYKILSYKEWYNDLKRIKYPYHCIDYAVAYISTLYTYETVKIDSYKKILMDSMEDSIIQIIDNNNLENPFREDTYIKISNMLRRILNEN